VVVCLVWGFCGFLCCGFGAMFGGIEGWGIVFFLWFFVVVGGLLVLGVVGFSFV